MRFRMSSPRALAVFAAGALIATTTGVDLAEASGSSGYNACANSGGKLALENASCNCSTGYSKVTVGAQGSAGPKGATGP